MMSTDYNISQVLQGEMEDIKNFHYFRLINPKHPDFIRLGMRMNICLNPEEECRQVTWHFLKYL